jgi:dTMP kinase
MRQLLEKIRENAPLTPRDIVLVANWSRRPLVLYDAAVREQYVAVLGWLGSHETPSDAGRELALQFGVEEGEAGALCAEFCRLRQAKRRPFVVSLEGLDGSGKKVQADRLHAYFLAQGYRVLFLEFPEYDRFFGREVGALLAGTSTHSAYDIDVKSVCLWFGLDRWERFQSVQMEQYDVVMLNRFTLSNIVYQCARSGPDFDPEMVYWISELEHHYFQLPIPDLYVYLDVTPKVSRSNNEVKGFRAYVGESIDLYEEDTALQRNSRSLYLELEKRQPNLRHIDCMRDLDRMRPIEEIHRELVALLQEVM